MPHSIVPTFVAIRQLVLHPILSFVVPVISNHLTLKCFPYELNWTVLEPAASMATVVPLVPMQDHSANMCFSHSTTSLRQSSCQDDPDSYPYTLRNIDQFEFLVCLRAPCNFAKSFLPFSFPLFLLLHLPFLGLPLSLPLSCLPLPLPVPGLPLVLSSVPDHPLRLIVLQVFSFLSTMSRHVTVSSTP